MRVDRVGGLTALVLGSAAGGGFPQWNCGCRLCAAARANDPRVRAATQASVAFTAGDGAWVVVGASPDLRQQVLANAQLWPREGSRDSPIAAVVLISADIDGLVGLLVLRERQRLDVLAPRPILDVLAANSLFAVLDPTLVRRIELTPEAPVDCAGLRLSLLPLPGKVALYQELPGAAEATPAVTYAALVEHKGRRAVVAPACAAITETLHEHLRAVDLLFFDGTLFRDDEMMTAGVGAKTGRRMGHLPIDGPGGSLARLVDLKARRVFLHINNTNPILLADSPERRRVEAAGFEVAYDGMEIRL
jgi:pyrroloquinoline quinone biosynthesis protein B